MTGNNEIKPALRHIAGDPIGMPGKVMPLIAEV